MKRESVQAQAVRAAFGRRLKQIRESHPYDAPRRTPGARSVAYMPQSVAASRAGIDKGHWARLEKGRCDPSLTSLLRIQTAFGLDSIEALLGPTPSAALAGSIAAEPSSSETTPGLGDDNSPSTAF